MKTLKAGQLEVIAIDGKVVGMVKGRNLLEKEGFTQSRNPVWWKKDGTYAHYNKVMKAWVIE